VKVKFAVFTPRVEGQLRVKYWFDLTLGQGGLGQLAPAERQNMWLLPAKRCDLPAERASLYK